MNRDVRVKRLRERVLELVAAVADPTRGDKVFSDYMAWVSQLHQSYSFANTALILSACPHATYVAGYKRWQRLGRQVRYGERGIQILVPFRGPAIDEQDPLSNEPIVYRPLVGFGVAHVWDVSQTDGPPVPNFKHDLGDDSRPLLDAAISLSAERGIEVECRPLMGSSNGVSELGRITINSGRPIGIQSQVILHELAHEMMHPRDSRVPGNRALHEGEAEAASWAVLQHFGVEGTMLNAAAYIRSHHAQPRDLLGSLERITTTAHGLIAGLQAHLPSEVRPHGSATP